MISLQKSKSITCLYSIAILLLTSIMPCACMADSSPSNKDTTQAHSCCEETPSPEDKQHDDCENCSNCSAISSCAYDIVPTIRMAQPDGLEPPPALDLSFSLWQPTQWHNSAKFPPPDISHAETRITHSSSLAKLLHRWLV